MIKYLVIIYLLFKPFEQKTGENCLFYFYYTQYFSLQISDNKKLLDYTDDYEQSESSSDEVYKPYVDQIDGNLFDQFLNTKNNFIDSITNVYQQIDNKQLKKVTQNDYLTLYSNSTQQQQFQIPKYILNSFKYNQTQQIRTDLLNKFNVNQQSFLQLQQQIQQSILQRQNTFINVNTFTERQIAKETILQCIATFLCQKFTLIRESYRQNEEQKELNAQQQNTGKKLLDISQSDDFESFDSQNDETQNKIELNSHYLDINENSQVSHQLPTQYNGFARPQVLIVTPYKHTCYFIVSALINCFPNLQFDKIGRRKLFEQIFAPNGKTFTIDDQEFLPQEIPQEVEQIMKQQGNQDFKQQFQKPLEFYQQFYGDLSQDFTATVTISKRGPHCIYLMRPIDKCDIIIGSPQSLLKLIKGQNNGGNNTINNKDDDKQSNKGNQLSFSSFTTVFFDNFDWLIENQFISVMRLFEQLHQLPNCIQNVNINTISNVFLNGLQHQQCQYITLSGSQTNEQNNLLNKILQQGLLYCSKIVINYKLNINQLNNINIMFYKVFANKIITNRLCAQQFVLKNHKIDQAINILYQNIVNSNDNSNTLFIFNSQFDLQYCKLAFQQDHIKFLILNSDTEANQINSICNQFKTKKVQVLLTDIHFLQERYTKFNKTNNIIFIGCCKYEKINMFILQQCDQNCNIQYLIDDTDALALQECFGYNTAKIILQQSQYKFL